MEEQIEHLQELLSMLRFYERKRKNLNADRLRFERCGLHGLVKDLRHQITITEMVVTRYKQRVKYQIVKLNTIANEL